MNKKERDYWLKQDFRVWPEPKRGQTYGPNKFQKQLFIEKLKPRPHQHTLDVFLFDGGNRCLGLGTPIIMYDGQIKKVEDIKVGDLLMGPDSTPRNVLKLARGRSLMYKITPLKGDPFTCNGNHILSLKRINDDKREIRINKNGTSYIKPKRFGGEKFIEVTVEEYISWSKKKQHYYRLWRPGPTNFKKQSALPLDPYFVGAWLGDGDSKKPTITSMDLEIVNYLKEFAKSRNELLLVYDDPNCGLAKRYSIKPSAGKNLLSRELRYLEILNNKHIPQIFKTASQEERLQLLAGLLDTDGYLSPGKYFEITQKREILAKDIVFVARSLGFAANIVEVEKSCTYKGEKKVGTYYRVTICGDVERIPTKILRKQSLPRTRKQSVLMTNFKVEVLEEDDFYGFELDKDHLYLHGDWIVSHNSGKTVAACARVIQYLLKYPGSTAIVGALTTKILDRTALEYWKNRFTINADWDHPLIRKKYSPHNKCLRLANGSNCWFLHFKDYEILRGIEADIVHIEEASLLPDESSMNELIRRLSGTKGPLRQMILTTNPEEDRGWMYESFSLKQFEPNYDGPKLPIGKPCQCQYCQYCLFPTEDSGLESKKVMHIDGVCPECKAPKESDCPGDQEFWRVVRVDAASNKHLNADYVGNVASSMSEAEFEFYNKGRLIELRKGKVYKSFSKSSNVLSSRPELDYSKPMIWSFDWNISYQCSVIIQEQNDGTYYVVDEIVCPESGPEQVAEEFIKRYQDYDQTIYIDGDPAGFNRTYSATDVSRFAAIAKVLTQNKPGYRKTVDIIPKKNKQIPVGSKVDAANNALCDMVTGERHVFISPHCVYLIRSLSEVKWSETIGRATIDDTPDKNAMRHNDKTKVHLLTHPSDAFAYAMHRLYKVEPAVAEAAYVQANGEMVEIKNDQVLNYSFLKEEPQPEKRSFLDEIGGFWNEENSFGGFYW